MTDRLRRTDLHYAAVDGDLPRVAALLDAGADPSAADGNGWTPLHFAAQAGAVDVIERLLAAGAVVDAIDAHGNTPLLRAVFESRGDGRTIQKLRAAGADPTLPNTSGVSPMALARRIANYDVAQFFVDLPEE